MANVYAVVLMIHAHYRLIISMVEELKKLDQWEDIVII